MRINKTKLIVVVGVFSAIAFILQVIGSMMGLKVSGFLEIELSDLPALIIALAYGPLAGVLVEFIKNLLHCLMTSTGFVGEFSNFVVNGTMCFVAGMIYKHNRTFRGALWALLAGTLVMSFVGIFSNLFIMLPLYMKDVPFAAKLKLTLGTILPFNLVKGAAISVITVLVYKKISKLIK